MPTQEETDRLAEEMKNGISQGPLAKNLITNNSQPAVSSSDAPIAGSGQDLGEAIDQVTNPGGPSAQDLATIQQANAQYDAAPQIPVSPVTAIGDPGQAALMPTLNQPINVGTTSGSIIGSHGVYVDPGTVAPFGALMSKQKQLQVAKAEQDKQTNLNLKAQDLAKKAKDKAFEFKRPDMPEVDDPGFQKSLNESGNAIMNSKIDEAKEIYGKDWQVALKSDTRIGREFRASMDGINVLARNANRMTEKYGEIAAGIKSGDVYYSPAVKESYRKYEQLLGDFEKGDVEKLANVRPTLQDLDGHMELNTFLSDKGLLANIKGEITGSTGITDMGEFMQLKNSNRTSYDKNIGSIINNVRKSMGSDYPYTDNDIEEALLGHFRNTSTSTKSLKPKPTGGSGSGRMSKDDIRINEGSKELSIDNTRAGGVEDSYNASVSIPLKQVKTGINLDGLHAISSDGKTTPIANVQKAKPVELVYIDVTDENGNVTQEKGVTIQYTEKVPIKQSITEKALFKPIKYEDVEVSKIVRYDDIKDQMRTVYGDEVNDEFDSSTSSGPQEGDEQETQQGTAVYKNGTWVLK